MAQICLFDQTVQNMNTSLVTSCFFVLHFSRSLNDLLTPLSTTEHETSKKFDISAVDNFFFLVFGSWHEKIQALLKTHYTLLEIIIQRHNLVWLNETGKAGVSGPSE